MSGEQDMENIHPSYFNMNTNYGTTNKEAMKKIN